MLEPSQGIEQNLHKTEEFKASKIWGEDVKINRSVVAENFEEIKRDTAHLKVKIIAVTKYYGIDAIQACYDAGIRNFGESRAVDALEKLEKLPNEVRENSEFHFIGHLQTNKVRKVVSNFDVIHSIDSLKVAEAVSAEACKLNKKEKVLLQVNNAEEEQKSGFRKEVLQAQLGAIKNLPGLEIIGLMNIAPLNADDEQLRTLFRDIREFRDKLEKEFSIALPELSMGMSNDYKIALEEGATIIRIGRKLFK